MQRNSVKTVNGGDMKNPGLVRFLFNDPRMAPVWAIVRVLVGIQWLRIAVPKLSEPGWMEGGAIVRGFWENQLNNGLFYGWYADFLNFMLENELYRVFGVVMPVLETAFGVLFIVGAFVGLTGLAASFVHVNYLLAGSAGQNAILFPAAILLVAAWKIAGYYGLDYFIMRRVSTVWSPRPNENNNGPMPSPAGAGD